MFAFTILIVNYFEYHPFTNVVTSIFLNSSISWCYTTLQKVLVQVQYRHTLAWPLHLTPLFYHHPYHSGRMIWHWFDFVSLVELNFHFFFFSTDKVMWYISISKYILYLVLSSWAFIWGSKVNLKNIHLLASNISSSSSRQLINLCTLAHWMRLIKYIREAWVSYPRFGPSLSAEPLPWTCNRLSVNLPGFEIF